MTNKVVLILVDGMRPDAVLNCGNEKMKERINECAYTLHARTVMPSVTLPCHMSLFHSVDPDRHGILTNTYVPQVRPVEGLYERLDLAGKKNAMFYTWEELRDLARMDHIHRLEMYNQHKELDTDRKITTAAIKYINEENPDFLFLYLGETDERGGHDTGWMSETYMKVVSNALDQVVRVYNEIPADYDVILTADHGGHDRIHGTELPEDMTIPIICRGPHFKAGRDLGERSIKDIAPTIVDLLGATPAREWEGHSFLEK